MLRIHWFLPTGGDSRDVVPDQPDSVRRAPTLDYLAQVARAADQLGFDALLTPCGTACEDAWITTAMLIPQTERVRFLVAFRPGLLSPTLAAPMASTYQRLSGGRVLLNIVTGAEPHELARFGDFADKDTRYARTGEFMEIMKAAWRQSPAHFDGDHYRVVAATTRATPEPAPPVYFGGASDAAQDVAARSADVYLTWGEPPAAVGQRVQQMRERAARYGRTVGFGIRLHVIARPTAEEAWAVAERLQARMSPDALAAAAADFATTQSEGQRRQASLAAGSSRNELEIYPNLWAGIGLVRGGVGTALVGSYVEVADRIEEYAALGLDDFILSGYPHLEEAYWFGEGVLPILRERGRVSPLASANGGTFSTFR